MSFVIKKAEMLKRRKLMRDYAFAAFMARMNAQTYEPTADDHAEAKRFGLVWNPEINDFDEPAKEDRQS